MRVGTPKSGRLLENVMIRLGLARQLHAISEKQLNTNLTDPPA
jgi:hypothetical protein